MAERRASTNYVGKYSPVNLVRGSSTQRACNEQAHTTQQNKDHTAQHTDQQYPNGQSNYSPNSRWKALMSWRSAFRELRFCHRSSRARSFYVTLKDLMFRAHFIFPDVAHGSSCCTPRNASRANAYMARAGKLSRAPALLCYCSVCQTKAYRRR